MFTAAIVLIKPGIRTDLLGLVLGYAGRRINLKWPAPEWAPPQTEKSSTAQVEAPAEAEIDPTDLLEAPASAGANRIRQGSA